MCAPCHYTRTTVNLQPALTKDKTFTFIQTQAKGNVETNWKLWNELLTSSSSSSWSQLSCVSSFSAPLFAILTFTTHAQHAGGGEGTLHPGTWQASCLALVRIWSFSSLQRPWTVPLGSSTFLEIAKNPRKEQALLLHGVGKIAVAVEKPTSATSGTLFSIRKSYWQTISKCCACRLAKVFAMF